MCNLQANEWGNHRECVQQDRYLTYSVNTSNWSEDKAHTYLKTLHKSSLKCTSKYTKIGSSAISTIYLPYENKIVWSNIGDGQATVFVYDPKESKVWPFRLNRRHEPYEDNEHARIRRDCSDPSIRYNELELSSGGNPSLIGVSRAYGAKDFSCLGLSTEPEYGTFDLSLEGLRKKVYHLQFYTTSRIFLFTVSKGFKVSIGGTDMDAAYARVISQRLQENPALEVSEIFKSLQAERLRSEPCKNCTGVFIELSNPSNPYKIKLNRYPIVTQVFDGFQSKRYDRSPASDEDGGKVSEILFEKALEGVEKNKKSFLLIGSSKQRDSTSERQDGSGEQRNNYLFAGIAVVITASICGAAYYLTKSRPDYATALRTKINTNIDFKNITEKLSKLSSWVQESLGNAFGRG